MTKKPDVALTTDRRFPAMPFVHAIFASIGFLRPNWRSLSTVSVLEKIITECVSEWTLDNTPTEIFMKDCRRFQSIGHDRDHLLWMLGFVLDRYPEHNESLLQTFGQDDCELGLSVFSDSRSARFHVKGNPERRRRTHRPS